MCQVCGCGPENTRIDNALVGSARHGHSDSGATHAQPLQYRLESDRDHYALAGQLRSYDLLSGSEQDNTLTSDHCIHFGKDIAKTHVPDMSQTRLLRIETEILSKNDRYARAVREELRHSGVLSLNLIASPGAGKTTLLVETLKRLKDEVPAWVIEGDQETSQDADRIRATNTPAVQINTGKGCHLDADIIQRALQKLAFTYGGILFIENVGNLACPAGFDLGEAHKVVVLSVTEGDDKPLKYPQAFEAADLLLISKSDLLAHCDFDLSKCIARAREVNPDIECIVVSARDGSGMEAWLEWIGSSRRPFTSRPDQSSAEEIESDFHQSQA